MSNKRIIIGSLATVIAAGAIGVNAAYAQSAKNGVKRDAQHSFYRDNPAGTIDDCQRAEDQPGDVKAGHVRAMLRAQRLRENGHAAAAKHVLEDAGIELPENTDKTKFQKAYKKKNAAGAAIDNADWEIFQKNVRGKMIGRKIDTREKFDRLVEAHELRKQQRHDEAQNIMWQLGVGKMRI